LERVEFALASRDYPAALIAVSDIEDEIVVGQEIYHPKALYAGRVHLAAGQTEEARAAFDSARIILEAALPEKPDYPPLHSALGLVYAGLGMKEAAIREGQKAVELMPMSRDAYFAPNYVVSLAAVYTLVGEYEAAINELEHVLSVSCFSSSIWIRLKPVWDPLRSDPRFADLLRRMNHLER
jgi:tetratricopeptide (TPR) repeat protein